MTRLKKLALAGLTALALAGLVATSPAAESMAKKGSFDITEVTTPDELVAGVNEYEGQHRVALNFTKIEV